MRDLVEAVCEPAPSEEAGAGSAHDRLQELLRLIGRDLEAPESSSERAGPCAIERPESHEPRHVSSSSDEGREPFVSTEDPVDAICEPVPSEEAGAGSARDRLQEMLRLIGRDLAATEISSARAGLAAIAPPQSPEPRHVSASAGEGQEQFGASPDGGQPRPRPETAHSDDNSSARAGFARSRPQEQGFETQVREPSPRRDMAAWAPARPTYEPDEGTAADDYPGSDVGDLPRRNLLFLQPRAPRRGGLAIGSIAGSLLIGILGVVGFYALSAPNNSPAPSAIADNVATVKATAVARKDQGEALNRQAPNSLSDQPMIARTIAIRPDVAIASTPAPEPPANVQPEPSTFPPPRAYPSADERPAGLAASPPAAPFSAAQPERKASLASPAAPNVDEQAKTPTSAAHPQVPAAIACQASPGRGGWWAWRQIDGRKCWYEGKVGMSKDNLRWVRNTD
jgi:hypothetical protein